jgi:hypothetical protein
LVVSRADGRVFIPEYYCSIGESPRGALRPQIECFADALSERGLRAALFRFAALIELASEAAGGRWSVKVESYNRKSVGSFGRISIKLATGTMTEATIAHTVLRKNIPADRYF